MTTHTTTAPGLAPPARRTTQDKRGAGTGLAGQTRPQEVDLRSAAASGRSAAAPTLSPPGSAGATASGAVTGTWTTAVTVDASWTIDETRNAYFHVAGGGWKKVFNGTDGAFLALLTLITQAKQTGHTINIREEADGLVHEVYLW